MGQRESVIVNGVEFEKEENSLGEHLYFLPGELGRDWWAMREDSCGIFAWWFYSDHLPMCDVDIIIDRKAGHKIRQFPEDEFWRLMKLRSFQ